jgi:7,8-dihydropterin-6-yl-methyl-4-(beta-D-ribofuranosyl)aminobenzene 5'-phosphate synthase
MQKLLTRVLFAAGLTVTQVTGATAQSAAQITILYDAFGPESALKLDWGFAALLEYQGKRILFDTGNNAKVFEHNVQELKVDLKNLDAVVISHRHSDHTGGLTHLLKVNPDVKIYVPREPAMVIEKPPLVFFKREAGLPPRMSYYRGREPQGATGTPWPDAHFVVVSTTAEIFPGFFLLNTVSEKPGTREMPELSLAVKTPQGLAVIVGCSHPGVEKILEQAAKIDPNIYTVTGGFHLVVTPSPEVERVASILDESLKLKRIAPGHCTSELGFKVLMSRFGDRFDQAGAGSIIKLP